MRAAALLERDDELLQLDRVVEDACEGRGSLVLVEGPAGIGKSRLLGEARERASARGMAVLSARASELDREFPFGVVRQLFEPLLASADEERRSRLLSGAARLAAPLLGAGSLEHDLGSAGVDPALAHFHALYWLTANLAEEAPAALTIDDIQWADANSLRFLQFLLPRLAELPVLVALATRPQEAGVDRQPIDALATDALSLVLHPAPLSDDAVGELVEAEMGAKPDSRFTHACRETTGGNPFLLRELLRELATEGVAPEVASVPFVTQLAPPTVARAVLLRLARLGDEASGLARAVAVLGDGVPTRLAAELAGLSPTAADELATELARADILTPARPVGFVHPILRSAVYSDFDPVERARAHRRAAALLAEEGAGADEIAVHLLATEPAGDPYVVATLREAAERALRRGAAGVAVACLRRSLTEPPPVAERATVLLDLASAEVHAGEPAAAAEHFEEGLRISGDPRARAARAREQTVALQAIGRQEEAYLLRERAYDELAELDPELALTVEASLVASASLDRSRRGWARERLERYRGRLTGATPDERSLLATQAHLDAFFGQEPADAMAEAAERALGSGRLLEDTDGEATSFFFAISVLVLADRVDPARQVLDQALDHTRRRGSAPGFAFASGWRCWLLARQGALVEAEADASSCAELALSQGWFAVAPPMFGYVLEALIDRGELEAAARLLDASGMADRKADQNVAFDSVVHARGRLAVAQGDLARGQAELERSAERHARWNTHPTLAPAVLSAPGLAAADPESTRVWAERALLDARAWGTPRALGMALHALGLVERGAKGLALLEQAVQTLEGSPARLEYARALADLGAAIRRTGKRAAAREPLRAALDLADACGARPLAERARQELRAAGGRPRRPRSSGVHALTASERRIAGMAAEGLSNPEIAQAVFITKKTVEAHLGNAYRKLDIHSRTQLGAALRQD